MIQSVKEQRNIETNELQGYLINNLIYVPLDKNNRYYQEIQQWINQGNKIEPAFTEEERLKYFKQKKLKELNLQRDNAVKNMIVEVEMNKTKIPFNADEISQIRLNRAITALQNDDDTINWIDANGNIQVLTKKQCLDGMVEAGRKQTEIFVKCAQLKQQVRQAKTIEEVKAIKWN